MMFFRILGSFFLITLCGCLPKERIWWSPNGDVAAVIIDNEVRLTNPSGKFIATLHKETADPGSISAEQVTWLLDGTGIIVKQTRSISQWEETRPLLPEAEAQRIESLAQNMATLLASHKILHPKTNSIQAILSGMLPDEEELASNALLLAYQRQPQAIMKMLRQSLQGTEQIEPLLANGDYKIHELALLKFDSKGAVLESRILVRDARIIGECKLSHRFPVFAFARRNGRGLSFAIETYSLEKDVRMGAVNRALSAFDWTRDGRSLVFMASLTRSDSSFKRIRKIKLLTDTGEQLAKSSSRRTTDLATAVIPFLPRLEVLSDGRILFSAQAGKWPSIGTHPVQTPKLYLLTESGNIIEPVPTAKGDLPINLGHFVSSPDGKFVAVVESDTDALVVVELNTGRMNLISKPHPNWKCRTLPSWRSNTELTYAALNDSGQIDWMLHHTEGDSQVLSKSWPQDATASWLEFNPPPARN